MADRPITIAVVAPSCTLDPVVANQLDQMVARLFADDEVRLKIHPQCYLSEGHFAGSDAQRVQALLQVAHDPQIDAIWLARGGYGAARVALLDWEGLQGGSRHTTAYHSDAA